jgi:hypothetical protein
MAMIDRNFTFATNGTVTANDLHNLIDSATIYQDLITGQLPITSVGTNYELLIADGTNPNAAPNAVTVYDLFEDALTAGTYTNANISAALTYGTATGTRLVSTNATITTGTITTGVIPTLTSSTATFGTTTSTAATITSGTITNLASTTGTIATLNSTTGTIATLNSTTGTIGTINSTTGTIGTINSTTGTIGNLSTTLAGDFTISQGTGTLGTSGVTLGTYGGSSSIPSLVIDAKGRITTASTSILSTTFATGSASAPSITTTSDTDTGIFFPAANALGFTTQGTEGARLGSTGNFSFNSGFGSSAVAYGCRAWVNFDGTGVVAIRGSGNVSSITDNGVGDYTTVFTTAMPDVKYAAMGATGTESGSCFINPQSVVNSTAGWRFVVTDRNISFSQRDQSNINIAIFR